jgi:hypothetical protein
MEGWSHWRAQLPGIVDVDLNVRVDGGERR